MHRKALAAVAFFVLTAPMFGSVVYRFQDRLWQNPIWHEPYGEYIEVEAPDFIQGSETFALDASNGAVAGSTLTLATLAHPGIPGPNNTYVELTLATPGESPFVLDFNQGGNLTQPGAYFSLLGVPAPNGDVLFIDWAAQEPYIEQQYNWHPEAPRSAPSWDPAFAGDATPVPEPSSLALVALASLLSVVPLVRAQAQNPRL